MRTTTSAMHAMRPITSILVASKERVIFSDSVAAA